MTLEKYLEETLRFYLESVDEIEDLAAKLDILIKVQQLKILENIEFELNGLSTVLTLNSDLEEINY